MAGEMAQWVRELALQTRGPEFESTRSTQYKATCAVISALAGGVGRRQWPELTGSPA